MGSLTDEEQDRLQQIMTQLNNYQAAVESLRQHISVITSSLTELSMTIGAIKTLKDLKPDTDILVPIGSDSFISAKTADSNKVLTGLGADVMAERTAGDATKLLESRTSELEQAARQAREELGRLEERIEALRPEAEKILKKAKESEQEGQP
ncbi:MAG TPA: prefoldin subunit alpha [Hadesarchaea archaeon]|nr:prefoldin subunit alpha [Hadesarchaea archaeon]